MKYVKSDIVDRPYFTAGKAYEVIKILPLGVAIKKDDGGLIPVITDNDSRYQCDELDEKDTWKWCDKSGVLTNG